MREWSTLRKLMLLKGATGVPLTEYTATGNPLTFNTNKAKPLKSVLATWQPHQSGSGDPSPSNVRPITGMDGVTVWHTGKNVWDEQWEEGTIQTTGNYPSSGTIRSKGYISCVPNATYYLYFAYHVPTAQYNCHMFYYDKDKTYLSDGWKNNGTFTTPNNAHYIRFAMDSRYGYPYMSDIAINYPSTETDYHPYHGTSYSVAFPVLGKNLLNVNRTAGTPNPTTLRDSPRIMDVDHYFVGLHPENYYVPNYASASVSNGVVSVTRTSSGNNSYGVGFPVAVEGGEKYTFNVTAENVIIGLSYYDEQWNYIGVGGDIYKSSLPKTFTVPSNASYAVIIFRAENNSTYTYSNIMLNKGTSALPYEPYTRTCYGGTLDLTTGVLTATHYFLSLKKTDFINKQHGSAMDYYNTAYIDIPDVKSGTDWNMARQTQLCNICKIANPWGETVYGNTIGVCFSQPPYGNGARISETVYDAISENDVVNFVYEMTTPITVATLSPTQITALIGNNTMWSDADNLSVTYLKKG